MTQALATHSRVTHSRLTHSCLTHSRLTQSRLTHSRLTRSRLAHSRRTQLRLMQFRLIQSQLARLSTRQLVRKRSLTHQCSIPSAAFWSLARILTLAFTLTLPVHLLRAQGTFAGTWTISSGKVAPWVAAADSASIRPQTKVTGHTVTFEARKISGPSGIACANPHYEIKSVAFDQLFEGNLKQLPADATVLGFHLPVKTLMPGCDFEFHMRDKNTALFALNNVIYTMVRKAAASH